MKGISVTMLYLVIVVALWAAVTSSGLVPTYLLPSPVAVYRELARRPEYYAFNLAYTATESALGASLSVVLGVIIGLGLGFSDRLRRLLQPLLIASQVFPKEALAPIILIVAGYGMPSKVVVSMLLSFFPVVMNTANGTREASHGAIEYVQSLGVSRARVFLAVNVPSSIPFILAGIEVALTLSVIGAVVGEFIGSRAGLGYVIRGAASDFALERGIRITTSAWNARLGLLLYFARTSKACFTAVCQSKIGEDVMWTRFVNRCSTIFGIVLMRTR